MRYHPFRQKLVRCSENPEIIGVSDAVLQVQYICGYNASHRCEREIPAYAFQMCKSVTGFVQTAPPTIFRSGRPRGSLIGLALEACGLHYVGLVTIVISG